MKDDIMEDVKAAMVEVTTGAKPDVVEGAVVEKPAAEAAAAPVVEKPVADKPVEPTEEEKTAAKAKDGEDEAARVARLEAEGREANGRFKKKADGEKVAATKDGDKGAAAKDGKKDEVLQPPTHWSPQAKADFLAAPRSIQEQALKREKEINEAKTGWEGKAEEYNKIAKVIEGKRNDWAAAGVTPDVAIGRLLAFENILRTNPTEGVVRILSGFAKGNEMGVVKAIAEANGFTLAKKTSDQAGSDKGAAPAQDNATARELERVSKELADIKRERDAERTSATTADNQRIIAEIDAVAKDPKNVYFENLRPQIQALLAVGDRAGDKREIKVRVQEAYDNAVWANPETRRLAAEASDRERTEAARKAEAERVVKAKAAAVSVSGGAPGDGKPEQGRTPNSNSIVDDVRAAYREVHSARA